MDMKIELIPESDTTNWHWIVLQYEKGNGWYNVGCGLEPTYEKASAQALIHYDALKTDKMNAFKVSWHASCYNGTFNYLVVAKTIEAAKELWEKFVTDNIEISCSWEKAVKGVKNHYGGYITWKEMGETNKEQGCYELEYNNWKMGSDHLNK